MAGVDLIVGSGKYFFFVWPKLTFLRKYSFFVTHKEHKLTFLKKLLIFRYTLILFVFRILSLILAQNIEEKVFFRNAS